MNLVAGATGLLGGEICRLLAERGAPLRLVRPSCDLEEGMKRATGIDGIFFRAKDPRTLWIWYREHLGIDVRDHGVAVFHWVDDGGNPVGGATAWRIASEDDSTFAPNKTFPVNYRVADLKALLNALKEGGCNVLDEVQDDPDYGKFGWVIDPEGNKVALWEPLAGH